MDILAEKSGLLDAKIHGILTECARKVHQYDSDALVILYGSQARGQANKDSDMDLLILLKSDMQAKIMDNIHDSIYETALENDIVISMIIKSISNWERPISRATPLYRAIENEGILVA